MDKYCANKMRIGRKIDSLVRRLGEKADPRIKSLGKVLPDNCEVFLVDGEIVRNGVSIEFALGGHHYVGPGYDKIPEGEIWVEDTGDVQDLADNIAHEIIERLLMKYAKMEYEDAHEIASSAEEVLRREECEGCEKGKAKKEGAEKWKCSNRLSRKSPGGSFGLGGPGERRSRYTHASIRRTGSCRTSCLPMSLSISGSRRRREAD